MEMLTRNKLPTILKFSNITGILKYFGYLDEWKWLLEGMNSMTMNVWRENEDAFINYGSKYKREIVIDNDANRTYKKFYGKQDLYENCYFKTQNMIEYLNDIWDNIKDGWEIILHRSRNTNLLQFYIWNKYKASEVLPALMWEIHKQNETIFDINQKRKLIKYLKNNIYCKALTIRKWSEGIQVLSTFSPIIKYKDTEFIRKNEFWSNILRIDSDFK